MLLLYFLVDILPLKRIHRREGGWEFNIDKLGDVSIILDTFPPKTNLFPPENLYIYLLEGNNFFKKINTPVQIFNSIYIKDYFTSLAEAVRGRGCSS